MTGASPSGAVSTAAPQTFTSPSGNAVYTTAAGEIPFDDTFLDTRVALNASWSQPLARLYTLTAGLGFSTEYDYQHLGANIGITRDFNRRNTTLSAALAYSQDDIDPVGGAPLGFAPMLDVGDDSGKGGSESKDVLDVLFGVTQVLGRSTVLRVNYSYSDSSGYLTIRHRDAGAIGQLHGSTAPAPAALRLSRQQPTARARQGADHLQRHTLAGAAVGSRADALHAQTLGRALGCPGIHRSLAGAILFQRLFHEHRQGHRRRIQPLAMLG